MNVCVKELIQFPRSKSELKDIKANVSETGKYNASAGKKKTFRLSKNRVYPLPNENRKTFGEVAKTVHTTFGEVAKTVHTTLAVSSHIARLKYEKPQPKDLSTQYDEELKQLYLMEWSDAVPQYHSEQLHYYCQSCCCCCQACYRCCDPEREKDTRELFKRVFPSFIFHFLVFTGALPAGSKKCNNFVRVFWHIIAGFCLVKFSFSILACVERFGCGFIEANCVNHVKPKLGVTFWISFLAFDLSIAITAYLVPTYLRSQFQSRELQTLISRIGPARVGFPTCCW